MRRVMVISALSSFLCDVKPLCNFDVMSVSLLVPWICLYVSTVCINKFEVVLSACAFFSMLPMQCLTYLKGCWSFCLNFVLALLTLFANWVLSFWATLLLYWCLRFWDHSDCCFNLSRHVFLMVCLCSILVRVCLLFVSCQYGWGMLGNVNWFVCAAYMRYFLHWLM